MYEFVKSKLDDKIVKMMNFSFAIEHLDEETLKRIIEKDIAEKYSELYLVKDGEKYVSSLQLLDFEMKLRNSIVKMGGIGAVVTNAIYRGKGGVKFMLKKTLELMKEKDYAVSVLYPFSIDFYRKYGWERFDDMITYTVSPLLFINSGKLNEYELYDAYEADHELLEFYNSFSEKNYNLVQKTEWLMKRELFCEFADSIDKKFIKFKKNYKITGMMKLNFFSEKSGPKIICDNFVYENPETIKAMFEFFTSLSLQISEIDINLPKDFEIWPYLKDRPKNSSLRQRSMIRIVDILKLDGLRINTSDMEFIVEVTDNFAEWNDGIFKFRIKDGILKVEKAEDADIKCDISVLSTVLSGFTDFKTMHEMGKVEVKESKNLSFDLPKETTYLEIHF